MFTGTESLCFTFHLFENELKLMKYIFCLLLIRAGILEPLFVVVVKDVNGRLYMAYFYIFGLFHIKKLTSEQ